MYPDLWNTTGESEADLEALEEALQRTWEALPDSLFESLVESMPRRIQACIEAEGWHTKYQRIIRARAKNVYSTN